MEVLQVCAPASVRRGPPWRGRHGRRFADGSGGPRKTAPQARPYRPLDHEMFHVKPTRLWSSGPCRPRVCTSQAHVVDMPGTTKWVMRGSSRNDDGGGEQD